MQGIAKDWVDYVSALTPPLVAVFVAYIAYRQWRTARQKLRLDLYNKRFAIFETTLHFYQELMSGTKIEKTKLDELYRQFGTATLEARFLFASSSNIYDLLLDFSKSASIITASQDVLKETGGSKEIQILAFNNFCDHRPLLTEKLDAIQEAMAPYLSFRGLVE